jgi:hypothetical protein
MAYGSNPGKMCIIQPVSEKLHRRLVSFDAADFSNDIDALLFL